MKDLSIASFYTLNSPYEQEVKSLINSCQAYGLDYHIEGIPSLGSWESNCGYKPLYIYRKLLELKKPILWVDADAIFKKKPDFSFFESYDISARIDSFVGWEHPSKLLSGTLFINYTQHGQAIVKQWGEECMQRLNLNHKTWDQEVLRDVLLHYPDGRFLPMPLSYVKIFDTDRNYIKEEDVVIEHYQASRRFKDRM
jgi:hypothetical protein